LSVPTLTAAVVGAGVFGANHARLLHENPRSELAVIIDPAEAVGSAVAERFGCAYRPTVAAALEDFDLDVFTVAAPDRLHKEAALPIIEAGMDVLIEKPLAHDLPTAQLLATTAERTGARIMPGHSFRFDGRYLAMKNAVEAGQLGELVHASASRFSDRTVGTRLRGSSSPMWYLGVHEIDALQWFTGQRIVAASGRAVSKLMPAAGVDSEDAILGLLEFDNGAVANFCFGWSLPDAAPTGIKNAVQLVGTDGLLELNTQGSGVLVAGPHGTTTPEPIYFTEAGGQIGGNMAAEFDHFLRAVQSGEPFVVPVEDVLRAVAVNDAILRSVQSGAWEAVAV
jgi:predicted dehydrogenase